MLSFPEMVRPIVQAPIRLPTVEATLNPGHEVLVETDDNTCADFCDS
jgi:hypothetical protein